MRPSNTLVQSSTQTGRRSIDAEEHPRFLTVDEAATFADVVSFAAEPITLDPSRAKAHARLVLVDAMELAWQRAKYRGHQHPLLSADPGLVGLNTLQHWLWQRLQASTTPVAA